MAVSSPAAARFALDVKGLDGLRRAATKDPQAQLKQVATQFEALFLSHMLKSMRAAGVKSQLLDNRQTEFYQSLLDQQLAQQLSGKGLGQARMLVRQLSAPAGGPRPTAGVADVALRVAGASDGAHRAPPVAAARAPGAASAHAASPDTAAARADDAEAGGVARRFVQRFVDAARRASKTSGLPALLILGQAALESGWGRHQAVARTGADSHNLFGIKAGAGWKGDSVSSTTHEYVSGRALQVSRSFRAYDSYAQSFADHAKLIGESPRYAPVRDAQSPQQAARALQACGYATDPGYADKLIAVMQQIAHVAGM